MADGANLFDQFGFDDAGSQPAAVPAQPHGGAGAASVFDHFGFEDEPHASSATLTTSSTAVDVGLGSGTGVLKGVAAQVGLPGSAQKSWNTIWDRAALGAAHKVMDWTGYGPQAGTPERADFDKAYNATSPDNGVVADVTAKAGVPNPTSLPTGQDITSGIEHVVGPLPEPQTRAGRYAETVGEFLPATVMGPGGIVRKGAETVLPAVASETAGELTQGSPYEAYGDAARLAAAAATGVGVSAVAGAASKAGNFVAPMNKLGGLQRPIKLDDGSIAIDSAGQPLTATKNQAALAGGYIENRASDPAAVRSNLANGTQEIVPGSTPTTFQQTGDMGLGQLERGVAAANPDRFIQRSADQNAARVEQIGAIQPNASPTDVANHFRAVRDAMDADHQAAAAAGYQAVDDAGRAMGGIGSTPETVGAALRDPVAQARAAAKAKEGQLWDAVDPTGKMTMPASPIASAAKSIAAEVTPSATPMAGEEARIFGVASQYGDQMPFREVTDLRSSISTAIRAAQANGDSQSLRRLTMLRGSVENSIDHGVENQAALDQIAVQRGTMAPEDAFGARLAQQANEYLIQARARGTSLARAGNDGAGVSTGFSVAPRAQVESRGRSGDPSRVEGLQSAQPAPPSLDAEAADRLKAASAATRDRAQTFDQGIVGKVLDRGPGNQFQQSDARVGQLVFHSGPTGGEDMRAYLAAGGSQDAASDAAAASLRNAALRPDGTFNGPAIHDWMKKHEPAINELPSEMRDRFQHSIQAQDQYDEIVANQKQRENDFRRSAAGPFIGLQDPSSITRHVGSIFGRSNAADVMGFLASQTAEDPAARDGLRRAIVDHIQGQFLRGEAGTSEVPKITTQRFIDFLKANQPALAKVFNTEEIGKISAVTQDLERAQRSIQATQLAGRSNTLQDYLLTRPQAPEKSILSNLATQALLATGGSFMAGKIGAAAGWLGSKPIGAMRNAGITRIDNLVTEAMLNPQLAKALLDKAPKIKDTGTAAALAFRLRQLAATQANSSTSPVAAGSPAN